jgi:hypothetical protein
VNNALLLGFDETDTPIRRPLVSSLFPSCCANGFISVAQVVSSLLHKWFHRCCASGFIAVVIAVAHVVFIAVFIAVAQWFHCCPHCCCASGFIAVEQVVSSLLRKWFHLGCASGATVVPSLLQCWWLRWQFH